MLIVLLDLLLVLVVALALAALVFSVLLVWWQRSLRSLREYVRPYAQLCALASWCGLARHPSDTPFEYAHVLAREVPPARGNVQAIADAYVRGTYGRGTPEARVTEQAADAWRGTRWLLAKTLLHRNGRRLFARWWPGSD